MIMHRLSGGDLYVIRGRRCSPRVKDRYQKLTAHDYTFLGIDKIHLGDLRVSPSLLGKRFRIKVEELDDNGKIKV